MSKVNPIQALVRYNVINGGWVLMQNDIEFSYHIEFLFQNAAQIGGRGNYWLGKDIE